MGTRLTRTVREMTNHDRVAARCVRQTGRAGGRTPVPAAASAR
jgi:hypothetical protein